MKAYISRRNFLKKTTLASTVIPFLSIKDCSILGLDSHISPKDSINETTRLHWLDGVSSNVTGGTAFGIPWPMGKYKEGTSFLLRSKQGVRVPIQSWKMATWPDGSLKWTGHALGQDIPSSEYYEIVMGEPAECPKVVRVDDNSTELLVDTGKIQCVFSKKKDTIISSVSRGDKIILKDGFLIGRRQDSPEPGTSVESFGSKIQSVEIEQDGPVRAVVKVKGIHVTEKGREWLPFCVRFYFYAGSDDIRMVHTFIFDGDENTDFISGLGVRFNVLMQDEYYNRHIRFAGQDNGLWAESVQGLTGLRRDPGYDVRNAQIRGEKVPDIQTWSKQVSTRIQWVPTWSDFALTQFNANGFSINKRTKPGHAWIQSDQGYRAEGAGYIGGVSGGVAFAMRDFWKLHPTQLDIRNAATDKAEVTMWMWSPDAPPMDLRFYHDGMGLDEDDPLPEVKIEGVDSSIPDKHYLKQLDALNITYEDYEGGYGTPHGVARSTDITLKIVDTTPSRDDFSNWAQSISNPSQLVCRPVDFFKSKVFGPMWNMPDRSSTNLAAIEDRLDWSVQYYKSQVKQHHWYGFWNYGDVMHTYDADRHVWRYDVGGFAWDNSELSSDLWLWYTFIRSGNPDAFRLAEAMNRHNRDVDIYHLGRFAGLGSRHNVQHWGCSSKQMRVSTCMNRRFHYYLTTDERTGDVLQEVAEADKRLATVDAHRKIYAEGKDPQFAHQGDKYRCRIASGTDFGAALANWLTAWERTGNPKYRKWIENSMRSVGNAKWGFFTDSFWFDPETKMMTAPEDIQPVAQHLKIMFGLPEVVSEIIPLIDVPEFKKAWLDYCSLWDAPIDEVKEKLGQDFKKPSMPFAHSRLTAYAAFMMKDKILTHRAVDEFYGKGRRRRGFRRLETKHVTGPAVLNPVDEASWVSTNETAQWGLAAIQNSALVSKELGNRS